MKYLLTAFLFALILLNSAMAVSADDIEGLWKAERGRVIARMGLCEDDSTYCGWIVWLKDSLDDDGQPFHDILNPDEKLCGQPVMGMKMFWGFVFDLEDEKWKNGFIYNCEEGKTYYASLTLRNDKEMIIRGSIDKRGWIGGSTTWRRVNSVDDD